MVSQREASSGALIDFVPDCDPEDGIFQSICNRSYARPADPSWSAAYPKILWTVYTQTLDQALLEEHWDPMVAFVAQLQRFALFWPAFVFTFVNPRPEPLRSGSHGRHKINVMQSAWRIRMGS